MWSITPFQPDPQLLPFIQLYWIGQVIPGAILPKAYLPPTGYTSILLQYGRNPLKLRNVGSNWTQVSKAVVMGQYFNYLEIDIPDCFEMIGILIKPSIFHRFFGFKMQEFTHKILPAEDVFGNSIIQLVDQLANEPLRERKIFHVNKYFAGQFKSPRFQTNLVDDAIEFLMTKKGKVRVNEITDVLKCSERTLQRRFKDMAGISPKYMGKVIQFNNLLALLRASPSLPWAELAHAAGYFDQSHMITAFIEFTGSSPVQYNDYDNNITKFYLDSYGQE